MRRPRLVLLAVLVVALIASACTSGSDSVATPAGEPATEQSDPNQTDSDSAVSNATNADDRLAGALERTDDGPVRSELFISPIFEAIELNYDDLQFGSASYAREAEDLVRQCMADAGFEYVPIAASVLPSAQRNWELSQMISDAQFSEQFGYGIATLLELDFAEDGVWVFVTDRYGPPLAAPRSEAEQANYDVALSGQSGGTPAGSCRNFGYETAQNRTGDKLGLLSQSLGVEYEELAVQTRADERTRSADREWQQCMSELGYSYEVRDQPPTEILSEAVVLLSRNREWITANIAIREETTGVVLAALNAAERRVLLEQIGVFNGVDVMVGLRAELDTLIAKELTIAGDDHRCRATEVYADVQREYEAQFVEEHRAQLEVIATVAG